MLPDCPHVLKTCKASFTNGPLHLSNERGNLSLLYTLRNKADPDVQRKMKQFIPKNDYVRNRDRQDPTAVIRLCDPKLCDYLANLGCVSQTIIPETVRFTEKN